MGRGGGEARQLFYYNFNQCFGWGCCGKTLLPLKVHKKAKKSYKKSIFLEVEAKNRRYWMQGSNKNSKSSTFKTYYFGHKILVIKLL